MRTGFKEWAVVVEALRRGEQALLLRKGGIHEGPAGFAPVHRRFWFVPTRFHQQRESVTEAAQSLWPAAASQVEDPATLTLTCWGEVVRRWRLDSEAAVASLHGFHIWRDEVVRRRFSWGEPGGVHALAVRVHRLPEAIRRPWSSAYDGCKSWVELEAEVDESAAVPVLEEARFAAVLSGLERSLGRGEDVI
ncbi:MAG: DUF1802 family protein [Verrucomicrobiales bacterium]|nr:DUF1802 family protein [Verrucomicrobiales bacterium]